MLSGHEISLAGQYTLVLVLSVPFLLLAGAGGIVFWVLGKKQAGTVVDPDPHFKFSDIRINMDSADLYLGIEF